MDKSKETSCKIDEPNTDSKIDTLKYYQSTTKNSDDERINKKLTEIYQTIGEIITIQRKNKENLEENNIKLKKLLNK